MDKDLDQKTPEQMREGEGRPFDTLKSRAENKPKKDYVPEGFESVEGFLDDMRTRHADALQSDHENREEALEDKKFAAGEQWDPIVLESRKGLPNLVINSIPQFTAQLVGDFRTARNSIRVLPVEDEDKDAADVRADLIRAIEQQSRANRSYDKAFESLVECGDGAFRVAVEYARDDVFDQDIRIKPIENCLSVVWDPLSIDPTGRDARFCFVDEKMDRKEFERKWPDADPSTLGESQQTTMHQEQWVQADTVKITEYWRMIERDRLLVMFENGKVVALDDEEDLDELVEKNGPPLRSRVAPCSYAQVHVVSGFKVLEGPYEYKINRVPIVRMSGRTTTIGDRRIRFGLVRFMKDPVRLRNFWRSTAAEQLGMAPKAQWIATAEAVEGREDDLRKAHLSRDPLLIVNDEATIGGNLQRLDPPPVEGALLNEANMNTQDLKDVTGIHDASLGIRSNEVSGKAITARQREGDIASLTYFDHANEAILEAGDVINQLIPQIYDGTRTIRLIGEDEADKVVTVNDPNDPESVDLSTGTYDVVMTTGPSYMTKRVEAAEAMMNAVQVAPELMQVAGDLIVKNQDWPGAEVLAERLKKMLPPGVADGEDGGEPPVPPQVQQAMQQMQGQMQELQGQAQQLGAENEQLKAEHDLKMREMEIKAFEAETGRLKVVNESEFKDTQLGIKTVQDALNTKDVAEGNQPE